MKISNSNKSSIVNKSSNGNKSPIAQNVILAVWASYDVVWACLEKKNISMLTLRVNIMPNFYRTRNDVKVLMFQKF